MTAQRALFLTAGLCMLAVMPLASSVAADAATPIPLGSLRSVAKVDSLFLVQPGIEPFPTMPRVDPVAQQRPVAVPGMPRDGGTNLEGVLRDPRAARVTPAGVRLTEPGWMRVAPKDRR